jgi:hypothetical protein
MNVAKWNLLIVALLSTFSYAQNFHAKFPGTRSALVSPNHRYILRNVDNLDDPQQPVHSIFLIDKRTGEKRKVYEYGRRATVLWSPNRRRFALNDYLGSNVSETYVIAIDGSTPKLDVVT